MIQVVFFSTEARVSVSDSPGCSMTPVLKDVLKCRAEAALMAVESLENLDESETEEGDTLEDDLNNKDLLQLITIFGMRQLKASYAAKFDLFQNLANINIQNGVLMTITRFLRVSGLLVFMHRQ